MDYVLLIVLILLPFFFVFVNIRILNFYIHPAETKALLGKIVIVATLTITECAIMLLPFDIGNRAGVIGCGSWNSSCGGLGFITLWQIIIYLVLFCFSLVVPFFLIFYESDESDIKKDSLLGRYTTATCYSGVFTLIVFALIFICYFIFGNTATSTYLTTINLPSFDPINYSNITNTDVIDICSSNLCTSGNVDLKMSSTIPIFTIGLLVFVGYFAFAFFCGIGLSTLPVDLIKNYVHRPAYLNKPDYKVEKQKLDKKLFELMKQGEELKQKDLHLGEGISGWWAKRKQKNGHIQNLNKFKLEIYELEQNYIDINARHQGFKEYNPLWPFAGLIGGILGILITILWLIHICIYVIPLQAGAVPPTTFLNWLLIRLDRLSVIFGMAGYGIFVIYLLFCAIKGVFSFGLRCFCIAIHPMERTGTYTVSFLFNIELVLLCICPCIHFSSYIFFDYTGNSDAQLIFNTLITRLTFLNYFLRYNIFVYAMLALAVLAAIYLYCKKPDESKDIKDLKVELELRHNREMDHIKTEKERQAAKKQELENALAPPPVPAEKI